jgi:hypothetical protein
MISAAPSPAFNHPTPREFALAFGRRLKERRIAAGYTSQMALVRRMSMHPMTVHKHEMQAKLPHRSTIEQYAWMLGCTPQYLLYGTDDPLLDLPEAVREYLTGRHAAGLHPDTRRRLIKVQWTVLCGDYLDEVMVHDVRRLIDDNLRGARDSGDERPAEQLSLVHVPVSREPARARRKPQHQGQAALAGW